MKTSTLMGTMSTNPYQSPEAPSDPPKSRPPTPGGTDWFALVGLLIGGLLAVFVGFEMTRDRTPAGVERRLFIVPSVLAIVAGTTFTGWLFGRVLKRFVR